MVAPFGDEARAHRRAHGAIRLVAMRTVAEFAIQHMRRNIHEVGIELVRLDIPDCERANTRRISDVAAAFQANEGAVARGMHALRRLAPDRFDLPAKPRLDTIEQAGLAHARRAGED